MTRRALAIATACGGGFLAFLDTTIVNTAFPGIAASFGHATPTQLSWVLDAYFIVIAALLVPAGGIADRVGRKRVFLAGVALFTLASAACAAAPGWETLVAARALQGAGAAVIMAVSLALILPEYPLARRAGAVSLWGASAALAAASGPPLGGLLVQSDWRIVFVVNLPLGVLVYAVGRGALTESADARATGLPDLLGAALAMLGLGALALAILEGGSWGWASPRVVVTFAAATVLLALTALRCLSHPRPVIDPELLRVESFARANLGILLLGMAFFSTILANVLFLTGVWHYSLLRAGFAVVPGAIATAVAAIPAGRFADRHGHRAVIVPGCLLYVAGMAIVRGAGAEPAFLETWLPAMVLNGAGLGMAFPALAAAALKDVPPERFGSASAVSSAARQFGGVLGTAVLFAVGAPVTLAAADDAYLVSTVWALGAAVVAATLGEMRLNRSSSRWRLRRIGDNPD
ncbi:DHA2 family efflux MFS transporter permease subunit [Solirubrobacter ginsenosidimutans]|uniref:DHA2 family efflux MFS transporter permease subunit n=1 Tax=Solirubrobacter ginsenosidimutans TaxID=490573 RepID=A0A9X3S5P6_9ACTN|nr:DHA2 family efflux MFS transporter permease subunit [Solirubrobacter ginsenosidimutans]MDA0167009.1 DHA2 family efflux MFS transporter permease subunit [Solirubrobacter ginsenosidimutans]